MQEFVWEKAFQNAWENGSCVVESSGHPSAGRMTDYGSVEIPENAGSSFGVRPSEEGDEDEDQPGLIGGGGVHLRR